MSSQQDPAPALIKKEVLKNVKEKKNITDIVPNLRSKTQEQELRACYKKLKFYPSYVIEGLLKKYPELQKQPMTGAERTISS